MRVLGNSNEKVLYQKRPIVGRAFRGALRLSVWLGMVFHYPHILVSSKAVREESVASLRGYGYGNKHNLLINKA
jgi:hypothetical protein